MDFRSDNFSFETSTNALLTLATNSTGSVRTQPQPQRQNFQGYVTFMILMSCAGVVGNTLVIVAIIIHRKLRVLQNVFIINLAVADLIVSSLVNPFAVVGALDKGELFERLPGFCEFLATLCVTSFICSIWSITSVSLNRYIYICHRVYYPKIYNKYTVPFMVVGLWVFAFLIDLPNYLEWGDHIFDTRNFLCNYDYSYNFAYTRGYLLVFGFITPVSILCYCYLRIYLFARMASRRLRKHADTDAPSKKYSRIKSADRQLLKTVAIICITFMVMWTPYAVTVIFDQGEKFWLFLTASLLAFTNSSVNFLIYATNKNFREAYVKIRRTILFCKCPSIQCKEVPPTPTHKDSNAEGRCEVHVNDIEINESSS